VEEFVSRRMLRGAVQTWLAALADKREREARIRESLQRTRLDLVLGRAVAAAQSQGSKRRRSDVPNSSTALPQRPPGFAGEVLPRHLPLLDALRPDSIIATHTKTRPGSNGGSGATQRWFCGPPGSSGGAAGGGSSAAPLMWKVVVNSGALDCAAPAAATTTGGAGGAAGAPVSSLHQAAATWLRAKLSCGRTAAHHSPSGELLTLLSCSIRARDSSPATSLTLCIQDVAAARLGSEQPQQFGHASYTMSGTSGLLLLVAGPPLQQQRAALPAELATELSSGCR